MTRLGWGILIGILILVGGFLSMTRLGGGAPSRPSAPVEAAPAPAAEPKGESGALLAVPVQGVPRDRIENNWGDAREGGSRQHHGIDIMAPAGAPVVAAAPGTIEKLFQSDAGGTTLYARSPDRRWQYYYAHLQGYAPGVREGLAVQAGDPLGYVGDTGNAGAGNYHLHFGVSRMRPDDGWWQGKPVNPYPLLARGGADR
ncbi:MAG TPA: M23 family metallopeptidase [Sphingomonas sp.]|nr:M23 family metallopeptidase [Sphingomonas sp.]